MKPQIRPDPTAKVSILHDFSARYKIGNTETFQRFLRYSETGWKYHAFIVSWFDPQIAARKFPRSKQKQVGV
jgi:hypothetical protein